jgi:hypothetical protein
MSGKAGSRSFERWVWTDLLAFDVDQSDLGVSAYYELIGFEPDGMSLLISAPDMVLLHDGLSGDSVLPGDYCSRDGYAGNSVRQRQAWTQRQLRALIELLHGRGCKVYMSNFTHHLGNRFHPEWLTANPESRLVIAGHGRRMSFFVLGRRADGADVGSYFAEQLVKVCVDYGFDGWHGADGYGPASVPIYLGDCSDDTITRFTDWGATSLPDFVTRASDDDPSRLTTRMEWVWEHRRLEWIEFWTDRWAGFWRQVCDQLHAVGRMAFVNSAWTRDPFEARYRYGIDYAKLVAAGVDGIVAETVAGAITVGAGERDYHHDYTAMLMLLRACAANTRLIILHGLRDTLEEWDLLSHAPTMLEREAIGLANVYHTDHEGLPRRCLDGFLACLSDSVSADEWQCLRRLWEVAFAGDPTRVFSTAVVWSDAVPAVEYDGLVSRGEWSTHRWVHHLMAKNAPVNVVVRIEDVQRVNAPLLVLNAHQLPDEDRERIRDLPNVVVWVGRIDHEESLGVLTLVEQRVGEAAPLAVRVQGGPSGADRVESMTVAAGAAPMAVVEPAGFRQDLAYRTVSDGFLDELSAIIVRLSGGCLVVPDPSERDHDDVTAVMSELGAAGRRVVIANNRLTYARPKISVGQPIVTARARTSYPVLAVPTAGDAFSARIPPRGVTVVDLELDQ